MRMNTKTKLAAVGGIALALVAGVALGAHAAAQANGSDAALYFYNGDTGDLKDGPGTTYAWNETLIGHTNTTDVQSAGFTCPVNSTNAYTFMSATGTERTGIDGWKSWAAIGFVDKVVYLPVLTPESQASGDVNFIKTNGGSYGLGFACTNNNGLDVTAAYYRTATVTAGTGAFTLAPVDTVTSPSPSPSPGTSGTIDLSAGTTDAVNGTLTLSVPANAAATFGSPTLVNNLSTTTGTLPNFSVIDGRVISRDGWTVTTSVSSFVNSADSTNTISAAQLGLKPKLVTTGTTSSGAVAGSEQIAGSAVYPSTFASADADSGVGTTVLSGDLTFVAPQDKPAGTYTSTMTVTVVSK